ncbi:HVO_0234 family beta-propeller protein [Halobaculum magnesiiphilum]|uniref:HVO-0234-like beta-propeller domain-containing protein n=1 Tax=Halobaculum magnesiiphilum TaxID=1017351 RepID=A0A8T8WA42_9EURY|nr:hypothetical protein [Halobaculum magnesiiphilum]QZP36707.1 hypothetical protein K6T50_10360 [Halobaculum magnesiiphilum]
MPTIAEKRVFTKRDDVVRALAASSMGVVGVSLSGDLVGEFGFEHRCDARDVAARGDAVAVATAEDVLVGDFEPTGHGPAVAVSVAGDGVLAAAPDGTVSLLGGDAADGDNDEHDSAWTAVGAVDDPRRLDGRLVAAGDGVHRLTDGELEYAGLDDARDVSDRGVPLAVTGDALYTLGNGWMRDLDAGGDGGDPGTLTEGGAFRCVVADADGERAVAATDAAVFERPDATATEWVRHDESGVVDAAFAGRHLVAVTDGGEARVYADGGWRGRTLGLPDVRAVAVPGE